MTLEYAILLPLKCILFQEENALLTWTLSMTLLVRAKVLLYVWTYDFLTRRYPMNNNFVI